MSSAIVGTGQLGTAGDLHLAQSLFSEASFELLEAEAILVLRCLGTAKVLANDIEEGLAARFDRAVLALPSGIAGALAHHADTLVVAVVLADVDAFGAVNTHELGVTHALHATVGSLADTMSRARAVLGARHYKKKKQETTMILVSLGDQTRTNDLHFRSQATPV